MSTIGAWTPTVQTCGHCLADFTGDFGSHTCARPEPHLTDRKMKALAGGFTSETARRHFTGKRATENLANALASSPTFKVELTPFCVAALATADALAHGEHLTTTGKERNAIIAQAAREYAAMPYPIAPDLGRMTQNGTARYLLGFNISVDYAISLVPEDDRETARSMATEAGETARAWSAATLQARADAFT